MRGIFTTRHSARGFTLVEMLIIAPIVILLIGAFIALIVNLTGEVMSSRGSNVLAYNVQDALNRIESDVKLSTTYLAVNNINISTTKQGYGMNAATGSTTNFTNVDKSGSGGSYASIILNALVTDGNPVSNQTGLIYLAGKPNTCDDYEEYSKNTPMTMNIVYFVDANNTLWRRVIMPTGYDQATNYCGSSAPWQLPTCINGYNASALTFCKSSDEKLIEGVSPSDFSFQYYPTASSTTPNAIATTGTNSDDVRNTALQSTPTLSVSITARQTVAGRDLTRTGTLRVTRLDSNASSIAKLQAATSAPSAPAVSSTVSDGHNVTFTWPRVSGASSYDIDYRINSGAWVSAATDLGNNERSYTVTQGGHTDTVEARVRADNSFGSSSYGSSSITIPLWAPLILKGNWTQYSLTYASPAYTKTKSGLVMFKGLVKNNGTPPAWDVIGSVPLDYQPSGRITFGTSTSPNAAAYVSVIPDDNGAYLEYGTGGNPAWFSLDTIRYASTSIARTPLSLQNGYTNYGSGRPNAAYAVDGVGRVSIEGIIKGGVQTNGSTIAPLPAAILPPSADIMQTWSNGVYADMAIFPSSGNLVARGTGGTGWYAINTSYLPSSASATWNNLSMINGWVNYGSPYSTAQYAKTSDNVVQLRGLIKSGTNTYDTVIGTLPAGFRPKQRLLYTTVQNQDVYARVDILPDGTIHFMGNATGWYSLSNILFIAEQ